MELRDDKCKLRQTILNRLKACCLGAAREKQSLLLRQVFAKELEDRQSEPLKIAIYASLAHEVDLIPLLQELPQHLYYFPRCYAHGRMEFFHVTEPSRELELRSKGFQEPLTSCAIIEADKLDFIIVPGVAFTQSGARLGYGGGFYDRYLMRCPQARRLALCFHEQIVSHIPREAHDLSIPKIISL